MEINITRFFNNENDWNFAGSIATHGNNAAKTTWANACNSANEYNLLDTTEKVDAFKDHLKYIGFSEASDEHSLQDLNALLIQCICLDVRESGQDMGIDFDWKEYEQEENTAKNLFKGVDNEIYYEIGY